MLESSQQLSYRKRFCFFTVRLVNSDKKRSEKGQNGFYTRSPYWIVHRPSKSKKLLNYSSINIKSIIRRELKVMIYVKNLLFVNELGSNAIIRIDLKSIHSFIHLKLKSERATPEGKELNDQLNINQLHNLDLRVKCETRRAKTLSRLTRSDKKTCLRNNVTSRRTKTKKLQIVKKGKKKKKIQLRHSPSFRMLCLVKLRPKRLAVTDGLSNRILLAASATNLRDFTISCGSLRQTWDEWCMHKYLPSPRDPMGNENGLYKLNREITRPNNFIASFCTGFPDQ